MVPVILIQFYRVKVSLKTLINNLDRGFQGSRAEKKKFCFMSTCKEAPCSP